MGRFIPSDGNSAARRWVAGLTLAVLFHAAVLAVAFKWGPFAPTIAAKSTELSESPVAQPPTLAAPVIAEAPRITLNLAPLRVGGSEAQLATGTVSLPSPHRRSTILKTVAVARSSKAKAVKLRHHSPGKTKRAKAPRHHAPRRSRRHSGATPSHSVLEWLPAEPAATPSADNRVLI